MHTVATAMFIGSLTNRSVCLPHFHSHFQSPADIAPHHFIDYNRTNDNLAKIQAIHFGEEMQRTPTIVTGINTAATKECVCLMLQGGGAPPGPRRCHYGGKGTKMIRSLDANFTSLLDFIQRPDIRDIHSLSLSPGMPFGLVILPEQMSFFREIDHALVHHKCIDSIANYVKAKEGVCSDRCTGNELYISTHPRLEDDFIGQLQMLTGFYQRRGINGALNNAIIDSFFHDFQTFLNDFSINVDIIHISTGLGKTGTKNANDFLISNYYEKRFRNVSSYHYEYLEEVIKVAHFTNHSSHFDTDIPDIPDPHNVTHYISKSDLITFHHIIAGINMKKNKLRELHAMIDFSIASKAAFFYGVCASSFTGALLQFVDISGCYKENSQQLQNLTKTDFATLTKKIDLLRKNSTAFFEMYTTPDGKYM